MKSPLIRAFYWWGTHEIMIKVERNISCAFPHKLAHVRVTCNPLVCVYTEINKAACSPQHDCNDH